MLKKYRGTEISPASKKNIRIIFLFFLNSSSKLFFIFFKIFLFNFERAFHENKKEKPTIIKKMLERNWRIAVIKREGLRKSEETHSFW